MKKESKSGQFWAHVELTWRFCWLSNVQDWRIFSEDPEMPFCLHTSMSRHMTGSGCAFRQLNWRRWETSHNTREPSSYPAHRTGPESAYIEKTKDVRTCENNGDPRKEYRNTEGGGRERNRAQQTNRSSWQQCLSEVIRLLVLWWTITLIIWCCLQPITAHVTVHFIRAGLTNIWANIDYIWNKIF